jgi:hypothetical protein
VSCTLCGRAGCRGTPHSNRVNRHTQRIHTVCKEQLSCATLHVRSTPRLSGSAVIQSKREAQRAGKPEANGQRRLVQYIRIWSLVGTVYEYSITDKVWTCWTRTAESTLAEKGVALLDSFVCMALRQASSGNVVDTAHPMYCTRTVFAQYLYSSGPSRSYTAASVDFHDSCTFLSSTKRPSLLPLLIRYLFLHWHQYSYLPP